MELEKFVKQKIEELRPRLLDLTKRNPLISARLNGNNTNAVRFVDELPEELLYSLVHNQEMKIVPLPSLEEDPLDERSVEFKNAFSNALLTDERYLQDVEKLAGDDSSNKLNDAEEIERALKDRLREELKMPPRAKASTDVVQHAKNNGITPGYDLPDVDQYHEDGRHTDALIQTLMLPTTLERRLNGIFTKRNSYIQETGLNVVKVAFGLLEWAGPKDKDTVLSPLVILNCNLKRKATKDGYVFSISAMDDNAESNLVLAEKLNREFGLSMPVFEGGAIENFMLEVDELKPKQMKTWRVRRQALFGIFPSSKLAMYHELDTSSPSFEINELLEKLIGGPGSSGIDGLFAETYDVDAPDNEAKVPYLVSEADSSQFSTLIDLANGENLAVEGPPGTGKSQTIVNAIAAALADGKKVLFVAEKLAALDVVKSRLEDAELGEFILPLQAGKSSRQQIAQSLRERLQLGYVIPPNNYEKTKNSFNEARAHLASYTKQHTKLFEETGFTVGEILERSIAIEPILENLPPSLQSIEFAENELTKENLEVLENIENQLIKHLQNSSDIKQTWKGVHLATNDRFSISEALKGASAVSDAFSQLNETENEITTISSVDTIDESWAMQVLEANTELIELRQREKYLIESFLSSENKNEIFDYTVKISDQISITAKIEQQLTEVLSHESLQKLKDLHSCSKELQPSAYSDEIIRGVISSKQSRITALLKVKDAFDELIKLQPDAVRWNVETAREAGKISSEVGSNILALRNPSLKATGIIPLLKKLSGDGQALAQEQEHLNSSYNLPPDIKISDLFDASQALRNASTFSFLSKDFKIAKKLYRSVSRNNKFDANKASQQLDEIAEFLKKRNEFENNIQAKNVFGMYFNGLKTPFEDFEALAVYLEDVDRKVPGRDHASLRELLKFAEKDVLDLLPSISKTGAMNVEDLQKYIGAENEQFQTRKEEYEGVIQKTSILRNKSQIDFSSLEALVLSSETQLRDAVDLKKPHNLPSSWDDKLSDKLDKGEANEIVELAEWCMQDCIKSFGPTIANYLKDIDRNELDLKLRDYIAAHDALKQQTDQLNQITKIEVSQIFGERTKAENASYWGGAVRDEEGLRCWQGITEIEHTFSSKNVTPIFKYHLGLDENVPSLPVVHVVFYHRLARYMVAKIGPELDRFKRQSLEETRDTFKTSDRTLLKMNKKKLRSYLAQQEDAPMGNGRGPKSTWTQRSLIYNEIEKKKRHISTRDLVKRAGRALQELKPCWMMSPLAVSQYIKAGELDFDLVIIDEASQMTPENALGALIRAKQAMIVGDTNQLPPTNFFNSTFSQNDDDEESDVATTEESILEIANGTFRPKRLLEWHYRSRDSRLISFCNKHVYDNRLIVFPSAREGLGDTGVFYEKIDGLYKAGTNPIEAKAVIDAVIEHMRSDPERSLGVVALNKKQAELLQREFDLAVIQENGLSDFIENWENESSSGLEKFFIKNLENVQGDERDVIFISTVYGPETEGARTLQRFGPIAGVQGKRRLNVLFSRAKEKIVTFSSMTSADITSTETQNPGSYMLKAWLEYAATGAHLDGVVTNKEPDSDFEIFVIDQLKSMGCEPVPQVGAAGFFIDIGVKHPDWPHGFIMAVECDGAAYHSSKSARDRDRYRQEILEGLGWHFYRIWSTDWFSDPRGEAQKLRSAIEKRLTYLRGLNIGETKTAETYVEIEHEAETLIELEIEPIPDKIEIKQSANVEELIEEVRKSVRVQIGDVVTIRYLDQKGDRFQFTISEEKSDPTNGIIGNGSPIAEAVLDAEEGEVVDVLRGSKFVQAEIEQVVQAAH